MRRHGGGRDRVCRLARAQPPGRSRSRCACPNCWSIGGTHAPSRGRQPGRLLAYPWDLVEHNAAEILAAISPRCGPSMNIRINPWLPWVGPPAQMWIAPSARIEPMVIADTTRGPVVIDEDAIVERVHTRLEGPCYVGRRSQIFGREDSRRHDDPGPIAGSAARSRQASSTATAINITTAFWGTAISARAVNLGGRHAQQRFTERLRRSHDDAARIADAHRHDQGRLFHRRSHEDAGAGGRCSTPARDVGRVLQPAAGKGVSAPKYVPSSHQLVERQPARGIHA